jgi:hypothetical protein
MSKKTSYQKNLNKLLSKVTCEQIGSLSSTRHFIANANTVPKNLDNTPNKSFKEFRDNAIKESKPALANNLNVSTISNKARKLFEGAKAGENLTKLFKNKWFKKSMFSIGGMIALSLIEKAVGGYTPTPIPKKYDRGYDLMEETLTDFGSPVNLLKTASKVITPYYSSVRKGTITNVSNIINRNAALFLNKNAIRHNRY